jgi:hypothetical protein
MKSPFPGMDPCLEHPSLWPDVHNRLIAAMADALVPLVAPDFFVGLERRAYLLKPDDLVLVGRQDLSAAVRAPARDCRILVSRGWQRLRAQLFDFGLRQPIPAIAVPLLPDRDEPKLEANAVLHAMCERARFELRLDCARPAVPPLGADDVAWAAGLIAA